MQRLIINNLNVIRVTSPSFSFDVNLYTHASETPKGYITLINTILNLELVGFEARDFVLDGYAGGPTKMELQQALLEWQRNSQLAPKIVKDFKSLKLHGAVAGQLEIDNKVHLVYSNSTSKANAATLDNPPVYKLFKHGSNLLLNKLNMGQSAYPNPFKPVYSLNNESYTDVNKNIRHMLIEKYGYTTALHSDINSQILPYTFGYGNFVIPPLSVMPLTKMFQSDSVIFTDSFHSNKYRVVGLGDTFVNVYKLQNPNDIWIKRLSLKLDEHVNFCYEKYGITDGSVMGRHVMEALALRNASGLAVGLDLGLITSDAYTFHHWYDIAKFCI